MTATVRLAGENHQSFSALWRFEQGQGTDFFTAEVLTLRGLVTYYVLFFIHLESRRWTSPASRFTQRSDGCSRSPGT
jgi:hypothetical protein